MEPLGLLPSRRTSKTEMRGSCKRLGAVRLKLVILLGAMATFGIFLLTVPDSSTKTHLKELDRRLVDLTDFAITADDSICQKMDGKNKLLQIGIHSSMRNYNRRDAIRNTWGTLKHYKGWQISIAFLLGSISSDEKTLQGGAAEWTELVDVVRNESEMYKDLVIGNFVDSYRNLTYKHMMGFKWILDSCPQVDVYIKTDDDVFVNIFKTIDWLSSNILDDHFYCYVLRGYSPWRSKRYKFYISKDEYKPNNFPDYCSGIGYMSRPSLVQKLFPISHHLRYLWVDDLFATGLLTKYFNENAARQAAGDSWDSNDSTLNVPAQIRFEDRSAMYLNEQYAVYKEWINDSSKPVNPWLFILIEKKSERNLVIDQKSLWHKTTMAYNVDNIH